MSVGDLLTGRGTASMTADLRSGGAGLGVGGSYRNVTDVLAGSGPSVDIGNWWPEVEHGVLTFADKAAPCRDCRVNGQVLASRYAAALGVGETAAAVVLDNEDDLGWALRRWLIGMVAFDRRDECWVWLAPDENLVGLIVNEINKDLTDPRAAVPAQQWAAEVILAGNSGLLPCASPRCVSMLLSLRLTGWRTVWFAGIRHYAPLFAGTLACHVPVADLNLATGAEFCCPERTT
jgi:hypothetical protein